MEIFQIGDEVIIKKESVIWHQKNNAYCHISDMDNTIGKIGRICHICTKEDWVDWFGPRDDYALGYEIHFDDPTVANFYYSHNCISICKSGQFITPLSKTINKIYTREKKRLFRKK